MKLFEYENIFGINTVNKEKKPLSFKDTTIFCCVFFLSADVDWRFMLIDILYVVYVVFIFFIICFNTIYKWSFGRKATTKQEQQHLAYYIINVRI